MPSVLLIDDEPELLSSIQSDLAVSGIQSRVAWSGAEATDMVRRRAFDVAIIDCGLPDIDGIDLISEFKTIRPQMECIVLTGKPSRDSSLRALTAGALAYIVKPFPPEKITGIIRERRRCFSGSSVALSVPVTEHQGYPVLHPNGDLDVVAAPHIQQRVDELLDGGHRYVLLDAGGIGFCDSSGLRILFSAQRRLQARGGQLALIRVGSLLRRVIELSQTGSILPEYESEAAAFVALEGSGGP